MKKRAVSARVVPLKHDVEEHDDLRELEESLQINEHALDEALCLQPGVFYRVSKAYALEVSRRDAAKQALQDAEARADLVVREEAANDSRKVTEGEVRATVQTMREVVAARDHLHRLSETTGKLGALKEAFQQRSYALKDLVNLYLANYYTASEHTSAGNALRDRSADENRRRMNEARRSGR